MIGENDMASAVMESIRALRNDDAVARLAVGSRARKSRIQEILTPIAKAYGTDNQALGDAIAESLTQGAEVDYGEYRRALGHPGG